MLPARGMSACSKPLEEGLPIRCHRIKRQCGLTDGLELRQPPVNGRSVIPLSSPSDEFVALESRDLGGEKLVGLGRKSRLLLAFNTESHSLLPLWADSLG